MSRPRVALVLVLLFALAAAAGAAWWRAHSSSGAGADAGVAAKTTKYFCPMHPTMVSDTPRDCPICSMRMVPMEEEPATAVAAPANGKKVIWRSTMNPNETSDRPGKDSMGMDMVRVEVEEKAEAGPSVVQDRVAVRIPYQKQQLIGVKTTTVTRAPFRRTIRAVGRVAYDETRLHHVHTKIAGYIERLYADATGEGVRKGQPLLEIYSPELLASQQEYLIALGARERTAGSSLPGIAGSGEELVASARRRLELFDLTDAQIRELETTRLPKRTITLYAPSSGIIVKRNVTHGERIGPETALLDLVDLSTVWAIASVYEYELPFVQLGQRATMALTYLPGKTFEGRVSLIYPALDPATRTAQVRVEFPNPRLELKPDMYADVVLEADLGERLSVPPSAVIDTGVRSLVFVDQGEGLLEPREVRIGLRTDEAYEVLSGLAEGEKLVTSGNFLIDSESKLKAALAALPQGSPASKEGPPAPPPAREHRH